MTFDCPGWEDTTFAMHEPTYALLDCLRCENIIFTGKQNIIFTVKKWTNAHLDPDFF